MKKAKKQHNQEQNKNSFTRSKSDNKPNKDTKIVYLVKNVKPGLSELKICKSQDGG